MDPKVQEIGATLQRSLSPINIYAYPFYIGGGSQAVDQESSKRGRIREFWGRTDGSLLLMSRGKAPVGF